MMIETFLGSWAQSFAAVAVAELFDKTWFVALSASLRIGAHESFWASYLALSIHSVIAAVLGIMFSRFVPDSILHLATAGIFFVFAGLYAKEAYEADVEGDFLKEKTEEANECFGEAEELNVKPEDKPRWPGILKCFTAVFLAEWGDRTQVAIISLHATLDLVPVLIGSLMAFFLLTLSAVLVAQVLKGQKLNEQLILTISAASFTVFAFMALFEGIQDLQAEKKVAA